MDTESESEVAPCAIKVFGSLFKLTQVCLCDDFSLEVSHNDNLLDSINSCNRPLRVNSSLDVLINECTPSLEDIELSQQMNAFGLPVSFSTSKKGAVVGKVKRKGNMAKTQFGHENDEGGTTGVSKLENGERKSMNLS